MWFANENLFAFFCQSGFRVPITADLFTHCSSFLLKSKVSCLRWLIEWIDVVVIENNHFIHTWSWTLPASSNRATRWPNVRRRISLELGTGMQHAVAFNEFKSRLVQSTSFRSPNDSAPSMDDQGRRRQSRRLVHRRCPVPLSLSLVWLTLCAFSVVSAMKVDSKCFSFSFISIRA